MAGLDDAFHKLDRAKEQLVDFTARIRKKFDEKSFRHRIEAYPYPKPSGSTDPRPWTLYTLYFYSVPTFSKQDGIRMGEIIQSFRSALDYLAWALYTKSGIKVNENKERQVAFPMLSSNRDLALEFNKRLPNVPANERVFIEGYQPYQLTNSGMFVGWLNTLSNTDKHRVIIPVAIFPLEGKIEFVYGSWGKMITMIEHYKDDQEVKEHTKIFSAILAGTPPLKRPVDVKQNTLRLAAVFPMDLIRPRPPFEAVTMSSALNCIRDVCTEILTEAKKFF
jgi:hypothetical protein